MKVKRFSLCYFGLFLGYICSLVMLVGIAEQTPVKAKQVDVITLDPFPGALGAKKMKVTVDVREASRNLRNKELYHKASRVLYMADDGYLSTGTVNLLNTALNDNLVEVRQRAIGLLSASRNPEAIAVITDRLQNDVSYRVRWAAAVSLGRLAGEAAIPTLKVALADDQRIQTAVISGLGNAGGPAVPLLIRMLKDDLKKGGHDADYFIQALEDTCDRRAIQPLLAIISHPPSPSDPNMNQTRLNTATVLAHFATDWLYAGILKSRAKFFAEGYPVPPREHQKVTAADRAQIIEALKNAGYDINRLAERFWAITH